MGQLNLCVETINPSCEGGGGNMAGRGEGFRSHVLPYTSLFTTPELSHSHE